MLSALVCMTLVQVLPKLDATKDVWMRWFGTEIYWPWFTLMGASITLLVAWFWSRVLPKGKTAGFREAAASDKHPSLKGFPDRGGLCGHVAPDPS